MTIDTRLAVFVVWGLGTVFVYTINVAREARHWAVHRDARARRDLLVAIGLHIVSLASAASILAVLFGEPGTSMRGLFVAISLGAYLGVGIVLATSARRHDPADDRG
jgi:hypothetical protein